MGVDQQAPSVTDPSTEYPACEPGARAVVAEPDHVVRSAIEGEPGFDYDSLAGCWEIRLDGRVLDITRTEFVARFDTRAGFVDVYNAATEIGDRGYFDGSQRRMYGRVEACKK